MARSSGKLLLCVADIQAYADSNSRKYLTTSTPSSRISLPIYRAQQRPPATWEDSAMAGQQLFPATTTLALSPFWPCVSCVVFCARRKKVARYLLLPRSSDTSIARQVEC
jgi:hypothetical protein